MSVPLSHAAAAPCPVSTSGGEPVESCAAIADRLDLIVSALDQSNATLGGLAEDVHAVRLDVNELHTWGATMNDLSQDNFAHLLPELEGLRADLAATSGGMSTVAFSTTDRDNLADSTTAVRSAVWFLAGLLAALLAATQLRAVFRP